jgi:hypothetical protein
VDDEYEDNDVQVLASGSEGLGVFAARQFNEGELIRSVNVLREITDAEPLRTEAGERPEHCAYPDGRVVLYGIPDRYYNHSCDPRAWERHDDATEIIARRPIPPGDEIQVDYLINNSGGDSRACNCGAARCRGTTGYSFFTLPPEIQHEYLPLLAPWFERRHAQELADLRCRQGG